jgi:hypothetical protein
MNMDGYFNLLDDFVGLGNMNWYFDVFLNVDWYFADDFVGLWHGYSNFIRYLSVVNNGIGTVNMDWYWNTTGDCNSLVDISALADEEFVTMTNTIAGRQTMTITESRAAEETSTT